MEKLRLVSKPKQDNVERGTRKLEIHDLHRKEMAALRELNKLKADLMILGEPAEYEPEPYKLKRLELLNKARESQSVIDNLRKQIKELVS